MTVRNSKPPKQVGIADLPLHYGQAPRWLFDRMVKLSREIFEVIVYEYNRDEILKRLSDPFWFQSLSCVLGYDWHSSGCTTVTIGALKEALKDSNLGIWVAGGKGRSMRKTPIEIENSDISENKVKNLKYSSKLCAKVDNSAIQSGHNLYHHSIIYNEECNWAVIQQGMHLEDRTARRYHWLSGFESFVDEPHQSIIGKKQLNVLNMVSSSSRDARKASVDVGKEPTSNLQSLFTQSQKTLDEFLKGAPERKYLRMPVNWKGIERVYEFQPRNYEELLSIDGVGPSTVRALSLISELIQGAKPSYEDPVRYSFTVGGKDGIPFPVDRQAMDKATEVLRDSIQQAKIGREEKLRAVKRLEVFIEHK